MLTQHVSSPPWFQATATHLWRCLQRVEKKKDFLWHSDIQRLASSAKYIVLLCSKILQLAVNLLQLLSVIWNKLWTSEAAQGRKELFRTLCSWWWKSFLSVQGFFFPFFPPFPSPRREAPVLFRTQGLQTRTLRVCWSETLTHAHTHICEQVLWCVAEGVLWHVKASAPGWRWNCSLLPEPVCLCEQQSYITQS